MDVFAPNTGEVRSDSADGIACWFIDTDYNEESFFVRQAYFLGANDPYKALRTTLKAEIDELGGLLLEHSHELATKPGPVRDFLNTTEVPDFLRDKLPDEFRAFCLVLNAVKQWVKQWVSAESAATDRYLQGGTARKQCRKVADHCLVTGEPLEGKMVELHHPVRDGRPPIPLSKAGHRQIEGSKSSIDDPIERTLRELKKRGNRSWEMLRRGCESLLGVDRGNATPAVLANSKTFARVASQATGLRYCELLEWLDERAWE